MAEIRMTYNGIEALQPGMEMDVRVACDVMGGSYVDSCEMYSRSLEDAFEVAKKFLPRVTLNYLTSDDGYPVGWHCCLGDRYGQLYQAHGCSTPAEAICKAALMVAHRAVR